ncbi:armadillo-type protein [Pholiota molesta]|nr:armadillo-type protein [Pholiota molesta]
MIPKLIAKLEDDDSDVRAATVAAVLALSAREPYQNGIKSSISMMINQMDNTNWSIREKTVQVLVKLAESEVFRETLNIEGIIPKLVDKLEDDDSDVRTAAAAALRAFSTSAYGWFVSCQNQLINPYHIAQLDKAIRILAMLSEQALFQETIKMDGAVEKFVAKLEDDDEDVRAEAIKALLALGTQSYFKETLNAANAVSNLFGRLTDSYINSHEIYSKDIKSLLSISSFVQQLSDESWSTRQQAIQVLTELATNADFQASMNAEKTDVCATAAQALSVFGAQDVFQRSLKSEKVIFKLAEKLSDPFGSSRSRNAARSTMLDLSAKAVYQSDIKATIPTITKRLEDENWVTRQQAIQILEKLSERPVFQETMKTEMSVAKLVGKLGDKDERVRAAAVKALSTLGTKGPFQDRMKSERVVSKLVAKFVDESEGVRSAVYNALLDLRQQGIDTTDTVQKQIDTSICKLLTQMTMKDLPFMLRTIAILSETADEDLDLRGEDLKVPTPANKFTDRNVVSALAQLAKHDVFYGCMKSAIPGLTEAVSSSDRNVRNTAIDAVSALSKQDEFRPDLIPAIQKLIQQLSVWREDDSEEYPLNLVETMSALVLFRIPSQLKSIVPILMDQLPHDAKAVRIDGVTQDNDKNEVAFYKATCKLISDLCAIKVVGKDLVPKLTCVLANMDVSLTEDLLHLVTVLIEFGTVIFSI